MVKYADLFAAGVEQYDSTDDAWRDIKDAREQVDWDVNAVRTDRSTEDVFRFQTAASDD